MQQPTNPVGGDAPLATLKHPEAREPESPASHGRPDNAVANGTLIGRTVTINQPRGRVYAFWRDFRNLPQFMENVRSVAIIDDRRSHWVVSAPADRTVEWDAIITEDEVDRRIAWRSAENADIDHSGVIEFRDASNGRGTEVTATIRYEAPGGAIGRTLAKLFQKEPKIQARRDLRRFKQLLETGEVSTARPPDAAPRS